jgi:hypothetical protein
MLISTPEGGIPGNRNKLTVLPKRCIESKNACGINKMRAKLIVIAIVVSLMAPAQSHAFGLLRYIFDGVSNQLGLDRGPIPKVVPPPPTEQIKGLPLNQHPDAHRINIQAEGF